MKKVLILFGGNSYEHEISCKSVNFVINNIDNNLFDYKIAGFDLKNNLYEIKKNINIDLNWKNNICKSVKNIIEYFKQFDIVFPVIHGAIGEDGKLQSLFEMFNINYVGCNSYSSLLCYDKLLTKLILEKYSIPQIPYIIYNKNIDLKKIEYPVIVKPCKCGSSIGIGVANNKKELIKILKNSLKYDKNIIIEKFIKQNRELECAIIEKKNKLIVSDIGEIVSNGGWYDYDSIKSNIQTYSKYIFKILGCKDLSRIDFLYDEINNKLYFNEINTIPGLTDISMYPTLIKNCGIDYKNIVTTLLNN